MPRYAQLSGGRVLYVIESEDDPDGVNGEWVACGNAGPGWIYANGVFSAPVVPLNRTLTKLQFLRLMTQAERITFRQAAKVNAEMEDFMHLLDLAADVDKDDPDVISGLAAAEAGGLLAPGRAAEILA